MSWMKWSLLTLTLLVAALLAWLFTSGTGADGELPARVLERGARNPVRENVALPPVADVPTQAPTKPVALQLAPATLDAAREELVAPTLRVSLRLAAESEIPASALSVSAIWLDPDGAPLADAQTFAFDASHGAFDLRWPALEAEAPDDAAETLLELLVAAPELQTGAVWVQVPAELDALDVELQLPEGVLWLGQVVDPEGRAIAGAEVTLFAARAPMGSERVHVTPPGVVATGGALVELPQLRELPRSARGRTQSLLREHLYSHSSDDDGLVDIGPVGLGNASLHVQHREYLMGYEREVSVDRLRAAERHTITLERGATLRGKLVDSEGAIVMNTSVSVTREFESALLSKGLSSARVFHGMAGWDGEFEIAALEPGEYELRVAPPGFAVHTERVVVPTPADVLVVLDARCERRVEFAGASRPEARDEVQLITIAPEDSAGGRRDRQRDLHVVESDLPGAAPQVLLPNDLDDAEALALAPRGAIPEVVRVPACGETLVVSFRPEGTLRGRVLDEQGFGIPDVSVRLDRESFSVAPQLAPFGRAQGVRSGADGHWSLPHWGPGRSALSFDAEGWLPARRGVEIESFGEQSVGDDRLRRTRRVLVDVVTADGEPAPGLRVALGFESLAPALGEPSGSLVNLLGSGVEVVTNMYGRAVFDELPEGRGWVALLQPARAPDHGGRYASSAGDGFPHVRRDVTEAQRLTQVRAWAEAFSSLARAFETAEEPETRVTLVARPRPVVLGKVSGLGALIDGAQVTLIQPGVGADAACVVLHTLPLDARGEFASPPLDPRPTLLALQLPWLGPVAMQFFDLQLGQVERPHFRITGQTLHVSVIDALSDEPVAGAEMSFSRVGGTLGGTLGGDASAWGLPAGPATALFDCVRAPPGRLGLTRADGGFEIPGLRPPGAGQLYGLGVRVRGYVPMYTQLTEGDWPDDGVIELRLQRAGRLQVTVLTREGDLEVYRVMLDDLSRERRTHVLNTRGGEYSLDDLEPGAYVVELVREPDADPPDELLDRKQVVLTPGADPVQVVLDAR